MMHSVFKLFIAASCSVGLVLPPPAVADSNPNTPRATSPAKKLDRSGKPRTGKASYYGRYFHGKTMADGTPMNPNAAIAASRTLPLGTVAKVTNLENGESAVVEIRDRGPYVDGRIIDLSPRIARQLGFVEQGIAAVEVQPLELPPADETVASNTYTSEK